MLSKEELIVALKKIQGHLCAYGPRKEDGSTSFCDCKYGGTHVGVSSEEGNGCPEVRTAKAIIEALTPFEYEMICRRINKGYDISALDAEQRREDAWKKKIDSSEKKTH